VLNYNHLHYFHIAAVEGSVAAAAGRLGVTQPTVSEQIRVLEKTLGVALFERKATGLKLTDVGRLAFEHTSVMFRAGERLVESLGHAERNLPATLRVGLSSAVARSTTTSFLMPLLALPNCVPTIEIGDIAALLRMLRMNEMDLVIGETEPPEASRRGLESVRLDDCQMVAVAAPSVEPAPDWQNVSLLQYRPTSSYRWEVEAFLDDNNLRPQVAAEVDDSLFLVEGAARGGHVAFVPRSVAKEAIAAGRLRILARLPTSSCVHALYQSSDTSELARRAVEVLVQHAQVGEETTRSTT
jgi:LysR family transcriptional regulator, transcriptional activator of nhaA